MKYIVADSATRLSENDNMDCQIGQVIYSAVELSSWFMASLTGFCWFERITQQVKLKR